jgi:hypothetical protein
LFFFSFLAIITQKSFYFFFHTTQCVSHIATVIHHRSLFAKSFSLFHQLGRDNGACGHTFGCPFAFWHKLFLLFWLLFFVLNGRPTRLCGVGDIRPFPFADKPSKSPTSFVHVNGRQTIDVIERKRETNYLLLFLLVCVYYTTADGVVPFWLFILDVTTTTSVIDGM